MEIEMSRPVAGDRVVPALHCYSGSQQFKEETSPEVQKHGYQWHQKGHVSPSKYFF